MKDKTEKTNKGVFRFEWFAILLIFIIAFVTGYFYTQGRLENTQQKTEISDVTSSVDQDSEGGENQ